MKIYQKLIASLVGSSVILWGLGTIFWRTNVITRERTNNIATNVNRELQISAELNNSIHAIQYDIQEILFADDELGDEFDLNQIEMRIRNNLDKVDRAISKGKEASKAENKENAVIDKEIDSETIEIIEKIDAKFDTYRDDVLDLLSLANRDDEEKTIDFWSKNVRNSSEKETIELIRQYREAASEDIQEFKEKIDLQNKKSAHTIRLYLFFSALLNAGLYLYIYRSIYAPFQQLKDLITCQALNADKPIEIDKSKDELEGLASTLTYLTEELNIQLQNSSYLDNIIATVDDSIIALDSSQNIQKVNQATLDILGYSEAEMIGKNISLFLTKKYDFAQKSGEATYLTKDKKELPILFSTSQIPGKTYQDDDATVWLAKNISEQYKAEKTLQQIQDKYEIIGKTGALWEWNVKTDRAYYSPGWKTMLGYEDKEIGKTLSDWFNLINPAHLETFKQKLSNYLEENNSSPLEITYQIKNKKGHYRTVFCRALAIRDKAGKIAHLVGSQIDITQRKLLEERLDYELLHDRLTKLPNRSFLTQQLQKLLDNIIELTQKNKNYLFALIVLDIDRFKKINDTMGYLAGDQLLLDTTQRLTELFPERETIARLEGNTFAILVKNLSNPQEAKTIANKIQKTLATPFEIEEERVYITTSIGIALNTKYYDRAEIMLADAKTALYNAKESGKGSCAIFEAAMQLDILKKAEIERYLQLAIEQEDFQIFYQPILELAKKKVIGLEAVIRWQHPEKGLISSAEFMPVAEESGLILPLSWLVIERVCERMSQWQKQHSIDSGLFVSVNVCSSQFFADDFIERLNHIFWKTGLQSSRLKLEIDEQTIKKDFDLALKILQKLNLLGIKVYVDNFGKDCAALMEFNKLPIDTFKLDRSLVENIENDPEKLRFLETVSHLFSHQGKDTIVAGVDKIKQTDLLKQIKCEYAQGAFFSGVLTNEVAEALIVARQSTTKA